MTEKDLTIQNLRRENEALRAALAIGYRMDGVNLVETICARVATQRGET